MQHPLLTKVGYAWLSFPLSVHLKENSKEFAVKHMVEGIIKKYSNFVGFPIVLNGTKLNTVKGRLPPWS